LAEYILFSSLHLGKKKKKLLFENNVFFFKNIVGFFTTLTKEVNFLDFKNNLIASDKCFLVLNGDVGWSKTISFRFFFFSTGRFFRKLQTVLI